MLVHSPASRRLPQSTSLQAPLALKENLGRPPSDTTSQPLHCLVRRRSRCCTSARDRAGPTDYLYLLPSQTKQLLWHSPWVPPWRFHTLCQGLFELLVRPGLRLSATTVSPYHNRLTCQCPRGR